MQAPQCDNKPVEVPVKKERRGGARIMPRKYATPEEAAEAARILSRERNKRLRMAQRGGLPPRPYNRRQNADLINTSKPAPPHMLVGVPDL